jgi:iron only hydrogenase large subunit-like protein
VRVDADGAYIEVGYDGSERKLEAARITLNDCLACSGCVTSAESILVDMQSHRELERVLEANRAARAAGDLDRLQTVVVTVAPQSRASFAAKTGLTLAQVARRLTAFLHGLGVDVVLDATVGDDVSLLEAQAEFVRRYRAANDAGHLPVLASACPGACPSSENVRMTRRGAHSA